MPQCHNMHSSAETTTLKSPNCFFPETNETKHNRKIPITTTVTFFGSLSLGPFLLLYPLCHGSCHTSAPRHPLARATKDTKNDSCAAATARARARRRRGADADAIASNTAAVTTVASHGAQHGPWPSCFSMALAWL